MKYRGKTPVPYILVYVLLLTFVITTSCTRQPNKFTIAFNEVSFDEELSSVGMINDSTCFIGTEHGSIYIMKNGLVEQTIHSNEARIYSVFQDVDDTMYVGIRNSSLAKIQIPQVGSNQFLRVSPSHFTIPVKVERYSAYGFTIIQNNIFAATSNGIYYFSPRENKDSINMIHLNDSNHVAGKPFVTCSPVLLNGGNSACFATDSGLVKIEGSHNSQSLTFYLSTKLEGKKLLKLIKQEKTDTLYALSEKCVYKISANNMDVVDSAMLKGFTALSMEMAMDKFYLVNETSLHVAHSFDNLKKNKNILVVDLPHHVPSNTRNVIAYDVHERMIRIVTDRALLSFPALNAIGESENSITHACVDKKTKTVYFLNADNELYSWNGKSGVASKIMHLSDADKIASICANNGILYYVTSTSNMMKAVKYNFFSRFYPTTENIYKLEKSLTSMLCIKDRAYIGIRDFLTVNNLRSKKSVVLKNIKEPYVTRLVEHGDHVFATTLNDGIWVINDTVAHQIKGTDCIHFMNDLVFVGRDKMLLLNNHYLYKVSCSHTDFKQGNIEKIDSIAGYERIFIVKTDSVNDKHTVMLVSKHGAGILHINKDKTKFVPIKALNNQNIQLEGCIDMGDYKLIAADGGILRIDNNTLLTEGNGNYNWNMFLKFNLSDYDNTRNIIFLIGSLIVLLLFSAGIYIANERKRMKRKVISITQKHSRQLADIAKKIEQSAQLINDEELYSRAQDMRKKIEEYSNETTQGEEGSKRHQDINSELHVLMLETVNKMKEALHKQCHELERQIYNKDLILVTRQSVQTQNIKVLMECFTNNCIRLNNIKLISAIATESPAWKNNVQHEFKTLTEKCDFNNWEQVTTACKELLQQLFRDSTLDELKNIINEQIMFSDTADDIEEGNITKNIKLHLETLNAKIATVNSADAEQQAEWLLAIKNETEQLLLANCLGTLKKLALRYNEYHKKATLEYRHSLEENMRKEIKTFYMLEEENMQRIISVSTNYRDFYPIFLTSAIKGKSNHFAKVVFSSQEGNDDIPRLAKHNLKKKLKENEKDIANGQKNSSENYGLYYYLHKYLNEKDNT